MKSPSLARSVVITHNGPHALNQTITRHIHKGLQLEVQSKCCHGQCVETHQQCVQDTHQQTGHRGHQPGGDSHCVNSFGDSGIDLHIFSGNTNSRSGPKKAEHRQTTGCHLSSYRSNSSAGNSHSGQSEHAEDQNRVEDDVYNRPYALQNHRYDHVPNRLEQFFDKYMIQAAKGQTDHNAGVVDTHLQDLWIIGKHM